MISNIKFLFVIFILSTLLISCNGKKMPKKIVQFPSIKDVPASKWETLAQKKIYFGHRSVGNNIIAGIAYLMKENDQIKLNIVETADPADIKAGLFAHSKVGENGNPPSKIEAFKGFMEEGIGEKVDIAFFKFCFVDIKSNTDIEDVFSDYKKAISQLKIKYKDTNIIHFTVPLGTTKTSWKTWIKKLMGKKEIWEYDHNIARNKFNDLIRKEYEGKEPIFDLAKIESIHPDGRMETFSRNGNEYYSLVPAYTHDGGHLNELGRKKVAEQLLILLANLS